MADFELTALQDQQVSAWDFETLKAHFSDALAEYSSHVYTDEGSAKADKAELNKIKKLVEDKRKEYKAQCLAPYEAIEPKLKELVSMIDDQQAKIKQSVEAFEAQQKEAKEQEIKAFYAKKAVILGEFAEPLYKKLFNPGWLNASASKKKYEEEMQIAVINAAEEIDKLKEMKTPFIDTIMSAYIGGASFDDCVKKNEELVSANEKAGFITSDSVPVAVIGQEVKSAAASGSITLKLKGSEKQLEQVMDFIKAVGVEFEILEK